MATGWTITPVGDSPKPESAVTTDNELQVTYPKNTGGTNYTYTISYTHKEGCNPISTEVKVLTGETCQPQPPVECDCDLISLDNTSITFRSRDTSANAQSVVIINENDNSCVTIDKVSCNITGKNSNWFNYEIYKENDIIKIKFWPSAENETTQQMYALAEITISEFEPECKKRVTLKQDEGIIYPTTKIDCSQACEGGDEDCYQSIEILVVKGKLKLGGSYNNNSGTIGDIRHDNDYTYIGNNTQFYCGAELTHSKLDDILNGIEDDNYLYIRNDNQDDPDAHYGEYNIYWHYTNEFQDTYYLNKQTIGEWMAEIETAYREHRNPSCIIMYI